MTIESRFLAVLREIHKRLDGSNISWALTGSMSFALHGMDVVVHDIDIQTDQNGAYAIEQCFSEYIVKPVTFSSTDRIRSHLGALEIQGVKVEIMGDIQRFVVDYGWESSVDVDQHKTWLVIDELQIPTLSLEYEYQAYLTMGRLERASTIRDWLDKSPRTGMPGSEEQ